MAGKLIHIYQDGAGKRSYYVAAALYLCCILLAAGMTFRKPDYNWDILPYMAVVTRYDNADAQAIHALTYAAAKQEIPAPEYAVLIGNSNAYRVKMAEDATGFYRQLPFYLIKPLYTGMSWCIYKMGYSLPASTVLPATIGYILIGLLLFYWLGKYLSALTSFIVALLLMLSPPLLDVARTSGPDSLSAFLLLAASFLIIERQQIIPAFLLLLLALFARLDNILLCILLLSLAFFRQRRSRRRLIVQYGSMLLLFTAAYFVISYPATDYGWNILYYPSFIARLNTAHDLGGAPSLSAYLAVARTHLLNGIYYSHLILFLLAAGYLLLSGIRSAGYWTKEKAWVIVLVAAVAIRFLLYPDISDRFYIFFYLLITILLVKNNLHTQIPEYDEER